MRLLLAVGLVWACGAAAEEDWESPNWKPVGEVVRIEDKSLAEATFGGICTEGEPACDTRGAALISLGGRRDVLLLRNASMGSCGKYNFYLFGPTNSGGKRPAIPEFSYCAGTLKYRPKGPDFLVSGIRVGSDTSGPSGWVFEDVRLRRENGAWSETAILVIDYQDGKPKAPKQD